MNKAVENEWEGLETGGGMCRPLAVELEMRPNVCWSSRVMQTVVWS